MNAVARKQLRHVFTVTSGATPESGNADYWDGDILWATPEDVSSLDSYWLRDTRRKIINMVFVVLATGATAFAIGALLLIAVLSNDSFRAMALSYARKKK